MLRLKAKNQETDRFIIGRSKEKENSISKYIIKEKETPKIQESKKLQWDLHIKRKKEFLNLLESQLFDDNSDNYNNTNVSRKNQKLKIIDSPPKKTSGLINYEEHYINNAQKRIVSKNPLKVLDAPLLRNDFYLHLLDWSSKNLLAVGLERDFYIWDSIKCVSKKYFSLEKNTYIGSIKWMNDGCSLILGTSNGKVFLWDLGKNTKIKEFNNHTKRVGVLSVKDESVFCSGSQDSLIHTYDIRHKTSFSTFVGHSQEVCGLAWSTEGSYLASGGNDNKLNIWSLHSKESIKRFNNHKSAVKALDWSKHKLGLLASGGGAHDKTIKFWNMNTFSLIDSVDTNSQVSNVKFNKNSNEIISTHGFTDNITVIWKYPDLEIVGTLEGHKERVNYLTCSPDGNVVATGAGDETIRLWNINNEQNHFKNDFECTNNKYNLIIR